MALQFKVEFVVVADDDEQVAVDLVVLTCCSEETRASMAASTAVMQPPLDEGGPRWGAILVQAAGGERVRHAGSIQHLAHAVHPQATHGRLAVLRNQAAQAPQLARPFWMNAEFAALPACPGSEGDRQQQGRFALRQAQRAP